MSRNVISFPGVWLPGLLKKATMPSGLGGGVPQRAAEAAFPGHLLLPPEPAQQFVLLGELVPLLPGLDAEQRQLPGLVALADDQLEAATRELVDGRVVLGHPHRVEDRQHADPGLDADPACHGGDRAEHHGHARGQERPGVPLAERDRVEAEFLGAAGRRDRLGVPLCGAHDQAGDRVLDVRQDVKNLKSHDSIVMVCARTSDGAAADGRPEDQLLLGLTADGDSLAPRRQETHHRRHRQRPGHLDRPMARRGGGATNSIPG
jgi:hypothetical protein